MIRTCSSTKENGGKTSLNKLSTRKRPLEHHVSALSSTQTFFPQGPSSSIAPNTHPFYQTIGSNNLPLWIRPESKQAYRKFASRPQTSKGIRPMERVPRNWQQDTTCHSQYLPQRHIDDQRDDESSQIEIIVTRSKKRDSRKGNKSKFQTDLDDEFLQLFAN